MKETTRSLRAYLYIVGIFGSFLHLTELSNANLPAWYGGLAGLGLFTAVGLIYLAARFQKILVDDLSTGLRIIDANIAYLLIMLAVVVGLGAVDPAAGGQTFVGLLIFAYIRKNMKRLSAEEQEGAANVAEADAAIV